MADGGHHLARLGEVPDQLQHLLVQAQVLGGPPPGHYQGVVALRRNAGKVDSEAEVVPGLLGEGLVALPEKNEGKYSVCLQYLWNPKSGDFWSANGQAKGASKLLHFPQALSMVGLKLCPEKGTCSGSFLILNC